MSDTTIPEITPDLLPKEPSVENPDGQEHTESTPSASAEIPQITTKPQIEQAPEKPRVELPQPKAEEPKSELVNIETLLSDGLKAEYEKMDDEHKTKFRTKGEKLATEVMGLLHRPSTTAKDVIPLITDWLSIIPGINKGWIASEARNRTEALIHKFKKD